MSSSDSGMHTIMNEQTILNAIGVVDGLKRKGCPLECEKRKLMKEVATLTSCAAEGTSEMNEVANTNKKLVEILIKLSTNMKELDEVYDALRTVERTVEHWKNKVNDQKNAAIDALLEQIAGDKVEIAGHKRTINVLNDRIITSDRERLRKRLRSESPS